MDVNKTQSTEDDQTSEDMVIIQDEVDEPSQTT